MKVLFLALMIGSIYAQNSQAKEPSAQKPREKTMCDDPYYVKLKADTLRKMANYCRNRGYPQMTDVITWSTCQVRTVVCRNDNPERSITITPDVCVFDHDKLFPPAQENEKEREIKAD